MKKVWITACILAISGCQLSEAQNIRRYFPEGEIADTLILTNSDHADMSRYAAVEIRASVPQYKEQAERWHEGFGVQIATTDSSYIRAMLYPANSDYGYITDQQGMMLKVEKHTVNGDSIIYAQLLTDNIGDGRHENSLSVEAYNDGIVKIFSGKNHLEQRYEFRMPSPLQGERYAVFSGRINLQLLVDEYTPERAATLNTQWTHSSLQNYFKSNTSTLKPLEGYWQYLDQNTNEEYAHIGGKYRLALVDDGNEGYNIIYVYGATINPEQWHTGMAKGHLTPTIFPGNLDMLWYDSEMLPVNREAYATVEQDSMILALTFPTLKSTMRLYRVPMDK